jgi:hypothetical protein
LFCKSSGNGALVYGEGNGDWVKESLESW